MAVFQGDNHNSNKGFILIEMAGEEERIGNCGMRKLKTGVKEEGSISRRNTEESVMLQNRQ